MPLPPLPTCQLPDLHGSYKIRKIHQQQHTNLKNLPSDTHPTAILKRKLVVWTLPEPSLPSFGLCAVIGVDSDRGEPDSCDKGDGASVSTSKLAALPRVASHQCQQCQTSMQGGPWGVCSNIGAHAGTSTETSLTRKCFRSILRLWRRKLRAHAWLGLSRRFIFGCSPHVVRMMPPSTRARGLRLAGRPWSFNYACLSQFGFDARQCRSGRTFCDFVADAFPAARACLSSCRL